jgi:hypothetical protein
VIESAFELMAFDTMILQLSPHQVLLGAPLTFLIFFIGTVLPTMVLIYAILLPRYLKLTGSAISTVLLGGLTYAAMPLRGLVSQRGDRPPAQCSLKTQHHEY